MVVVAALSVPNQKEKVAFHGEKINLDLNVHLDWNAFKKNFVYRVEVSLTR